MSENEKAIAIIKKRIRILERRKETDKRYGNRRAAQESVAIIRELRRILAEIEQSEGEGERKQKKEEKQIVSSYHRSSSEVGRRNPK